MGVDAIHWGFLEDECCLKDVHVICLDKKEKYSGGGLTGKHRRLRKYLSLYFSSLMAKENAFGLDKGD